MNLCAGVMNFWIEIYFFSFFFFFSFAFFFMYVFTPLGEITDKPDGTAHEVRYTRGLEGIKRGIVSVQHVSRGTGCLKERCYCIKKGKSIYG